MKRPRVVIVGHVCVDHNITEHATYRSWGSPAMYIADYYRRNLGLATTIIAPWGEDFRSYAADVAMIPRVPNQPGTLLYRNIITPDLRTWYCEHAAYADPPALDNDAITALRQADICILATLLPNYPVPYVKEALSFTSDNCVTAMCTQGYMRTISVQNKIKPRRFAEAAELLPLFDITVLSSDDHPEADVMVREWKLLAGVGNNNIILTQGVNGASIIGQNFISRIPTVPVADEDIIDSVGCGDVFLGALVHEYYLLRDVRKAVIKAHDAARNKLLALNPDAAAESTDNF